MKDATGSFSYELDGLERPDWTARITEICEAEGAFHALAPGYAALQIDQGSSLLVSFETVPSVRKHHEDDAPLGWRMARDNGWSSLVILADERDSWFRHEGVYGLFDRLIDDGYFDQFAHVLFFGAGGAGYAAAAYSVAAPEAQVLALHPQATLDSVAARWDRRHIEQRRHDFRSRYGYAPRMLETAERAVILFDPTIPEDAMHASLFAAPHVTLFETPRLGPVIVRDLAGMGVLDPMLEAAMEGTLGPDRLAALWRARRSHLPYLRGLFHRLDAAERTGLLERLCRFAVRKNGRPMFARKLAEIESERETQDARG